MEMRAFIIASFCLSSLMCQHSGDDCVFKHEKSSFDLRPLRMGLTSSYRVRDYDDGPERNYTYVFNVCGNSAVPDDGCVQTQSGEGPAPVFQLFNDGQCWRLGKMYTINSPSEWAMLDKDDPTKGVSMTYKGGDTCNIQGKNISREFTIRFKCSSAYGRDPDSRVDENSCHYGIDFETIFGCPIECPFNNREICSGKGMCGMDTDLGAPRCFCDKGWSGKDCGYEGEKPTAGACEGFCVALVFIVLIMGLLFVAGSFVLYRVWKLNKLNARFGQMTHGLVPGADRAETFSLTGAVKGVIGNRHS